MATAVYCNLTRSVASTLAIAAATGGCEVSAQTGIGGTAGRSSGVSPDGGAATPAAGSVSESLPHARQLTRLPTITAHTDGGVATPQPPLQVPDGEVPGYCGDGVRDVVEEQCDDGPGTTPDACSANCRLQDVVFAYVPESEEYPVQLSLGAGPHAVSAGSTGFGITYVMSTFFETTVWLARFDAWGTQIGEPLLVSAEAQPSLTPDPVVAILPDGAYAVAWGDGASGTPDVRIRRVEPSGQLGPLRYVHEGTSGNQQGCDLLWVGGELVAAYSENFDIRTRRLGEDLLPLGTTDAVSVSGALDTSVSLEAMNDGFAVTWRENSAGVERVHARLGAVAWTSQPMSPVTEVDRPRITRLDARRLLLLFGAAVDSDNDNTVDLPQLRWAVLDIREPGTIDGHPLGDPSGTEPSTSPVLQRHVTAARVSDKVYLAWQMGEAAAGRDKYVWWTEVSSETSAAALVRTEEAAISLSSTLPGNEAQPVFGASPLTPGGALVVAWEKTKEPTTTELVVGFRPSPFL